MGRNKIAIPLKIPNQTVNRLPRFHLPGWIYWRSVIASFSLLHLPSHNRARNYSNIDLQTLDPIRHRLNSFSHFFFKWYQSKTMMALHHNSKGSCSYRFSCLLPAQKDRIGVPWT